MPAEPPQPSGAQARPTPAELGARVAALREAAGLSIDQVAAATRIRAGLLRSIEDGDFAPCGGAVYARGHLRSIASVLHADGAELVTAYDRMAGAPSPSAATIAEQPHEPAAHVPFAEVSETGGGAAPGAGRPLPTPVSVTGSRDHHATTAGPGTGGPALVLPGGASRERRGSPLTLIGIGVAAVIALVAALALVLPSHKGSGGSGVTAGGGSSRPATVATTSAAPPTPTAPATLAYAGVNVTVKVTSQASWVHVTGSGGSTLFQGTLTPGTSKDFHDADQLKFVFGYAPAIDLVYNGKDVGQPPTSGAGSYVANSTFTAQSTSG